MGFIAMKLRFHCVLWGGIWLEPLKPTPASLRGCQVLPAG